MGFNDVVIADVTSAYAVIGIWGPKSREIVQKLTPTDMSNHNFKFMQSKEITLADVPVRATRITYVGELGWEFYVPTEFGTTLWNELMAAGESNGLLPCGYRAIESLRLEKGYRAWGGEINTETNPYEAGLGFAVSLSKPKFIGRDALVTLKDQINRKLVAITFDDIRQVPLGNEPIRIDEKIVGRVKSGGQGYSIGKAIGYAYLPIEFASSGQQVDVEFFGTWCSGTVTNGSLYDPDGLKIKA